LKRIVFLFGFAGLVIGLILILSARMRDLEDIDLGGFALD
jgi:hypothetical protein